MINTRSKRKYNVKTPGGRNVVHIKMKKQAAARCINCRAKLNRIKPTKHDVGKMTRSQRRPERPYPDLCPSCMRNKVKELVR
jgi:large subunit ribosomal protein L34e